MDSTMKKRGRPPKNGTTEPWRFGRALQVVHAYTKARNSGEKHSAAVKEAINFVRRLDPETPISESEVKRVLAELLPQNGPTAVLAEYSVLEGDEAAETRRYLEQLIGQAVANRPAVLDIQDRGRPLKKFTIKLVDRPKYPRHNAKSSKP
jgi:hypothetical protein